MSHFKWGDLLGGLEKLSGFGKWLPDGKSDQRAFRL